MQILPFACTDGFFQWRTAILSARSQRVSDITAPPDRIRDLIAQSLRGQTCVATGHPGLTDAWSRGNLAVFCATVGTRSNWTGFLARWLRLGAS
jgi:hypothetical protein